MKQRDKGWMDSFLLTVLFALVKVIFNENSQGISTWLHFVPKQILEKCPFILSGFSEKQPVGICRVTYSNFS